MSEFASFAVKRARKYVFGKSKQYVQTKVKQAVQAVERKATETIKRAAEDIVDNVNTKRRRIMPRKGLLMGNRGRSRGISMTAKRGKRRKFSRALRKRRSGYNVKSLKKVMRKIALNASQTKRHAFGHPLNVDSGDVDGLPLRAIQTSIYPVTSNLRADVPSNVESWNGNHFFITGIQVAGQVRNKDTTTRLGVRVMIFKDEVSGFDYSTMDETSSQLLWYNRATGTGTRFVSLPEPYKHAPKLMKGQNAKMVWSQTFELDYRSSDTGESNTADRGTFKKYIPINREMYLKTKDSNRPQCQWWFAVTHYRLDMESTWNHPSVDLTPSMCLTGTVYFKDP